MEPRCLIYLLMVVGQIWTYRQEPGSLENAEKLDFLQRPSSPVSRSNGRVVKSPKIKAFHYSFFISKIINTY